MSKNKDVDPKLTRERHAQVSALIVHLQDKLPADAVRIEIDIEYADGGRVKTESRA